MQNKCSLETDRHSVHIFIHIIKSREVKLPAFQLSWLSFEEPSLIAFAEHIYLQEVRLISSQGKITFSSGQSPMYNLSSLDHPYCLSSWTISQKKLTYIFSLSN